MSKILSAFNKSRDEVVKSSKVSKARLDISSLKKEKGRVFEKLGEKVYRKHKENKLSVSGFDPFFTEIDIIDQKLSSKELELKGLKGEVAVSSSVGEIEGKGSPQKGKRPHAKTTTPPVVGGEGETAGPEAAFSRPKRKYYRPRRRPSEGKEEHSNNMGL